MSKQHNNNNYRTIIVIVLATASLFALVSGTAQSLIPNNR